MEKNSCQKDSGLEKCHGEPFYPTGGDRSSCSERTINLVSFRVDEQTPSGKNEFISSGAESSSY